MSVVRVVPPFEVFPDVDGDPLDSGSIYVGQSGLNPEIPANQLPVFWDADLTIPAAQPIRTLGGFPIRDGAPANFYVDATSYSISVRNKNGSLVYSNLQISFSFENFNTTLLCQTVSDMKLSPILLVNGRSIPIEEIGPVANTGFLIQTTYYSTDGKCGGGVYEVKTLVQHIIDISNPTWVPDGHADHYLFTGTTYVAILQGKDNLNPQQFGMIPGSALYRSINTGILISMWDNFCDPGGGVIRFPAGEYYFDEVTLTLTGTSAFKNERGFVGDGCGNTILYFANGENVPVIQNDANPAFFTRWEEFTAVSDAGTKLPYFFDCLEGIPRTRMQGLLFINFKDPMRIHAWVSTFSRIESLTCKIGFTWNSGTSMKVDSCYALNCDYGHLIGCRLEDSGDFEAGRMLSYSHFSALAADGNNIADYVIGDSETCTLTSCGAEESEGTTFYAPALLNAIGTQGSRLRKLSVDNFSSASAASGSTLFKFGRTNIHAEFNDLVASTGYTTLVAFENGITYADPLDISLNSYSGSALIPAQVTHNFKIDGEYVGNVSAIMQSTATPDWLRASSLDKRKTTLYMAGDDELRLSLIGTATGLFETMEAVITVFPENNTGSASTLVSGQLIIAAQASTSGTPDIVSVKNVDTPANIAVSSGASILNSCGTDVIVTFANAAAGSGVRLRVNIEMRSSAVSSGTHHFIYVN